MDKVRDSDGLLAAIERGGLDEAARYWDAKFGHRTGLRSALLALADQGMIEAEVLGEGERREVLWARTLELPPPSVASDIATQPARKEIGIDSEISRNVFVVHGRDDQLRTSMFEFLRSIDLRPLEWSELTAAAGGSPYIGDLLDLGFGNAQAFVIMFTPDEEVALSSHIPSHDRDAGYQARPNVIFEAGLAMGRHPDRTVIVEVGRLRPISDLTGRHTVRLDDTSEGRVALRQDLARRLESAGCPVSLAGSDWHEVGRFIAP